MHRFSLGLILADRILCTEIIRHLSDKLDMHSMMHGYATFYGHIRAGKKIVKLLVFVFYRKILRYFRATCTKNWSVQHTYNKAAKQFRFLLDTVSAGQEIN